MPAFLAPFIDGRLLFAGLALLVAGLGLAGFTPWPALRALYVVIVGLGLGLVWASAAPLPLASWLAVLAAPALARLGEWLRWRPALTWTARAAGGVALALVAVAELPWLAAPRLEAGGAAVAIIGDSISAGIDDRTPTWTTQLATLTGRQVFSSSQAGARTRDGHRLARAVPADAGLVLIELGGNDLLGGERVEDFERELRALVGELQARGHRVAVFELPLHPLRRSFGTAQRRVVTEAGAILIPKRVLARVLTTPGATMDGLHLSEAGHAQLAHAVAGLL